MKQKIETFGSFYFQAIQCGCRKDTGSMATINRAAYFPREQDAMAFAELICEQFDLGDNKVIVRGSWVSFNSKHP